MELLTITLFAFIIAFLIFCVGYFTSCGNDQKTTKNAFNKRNVKFVPQRNLFVDIVQKIRIELRRHDHIQAHGQVFGHMMMGAPTIVVSDPELVELILSKHFTNFINRRPFPVIDPRMPDFIFTMRDENWKRVRATMTPTFATGKLRLMKTILDGTVKTMLKNAEDIRLKSNNIINLREIFSAYTIESIIQIAFGIKIDSLVDKNNPIYLMSRNIFQNDFSFIKSIKGTIIFLLPGVAKMFDIRIFGPEFEFFGKISQEIIDKKREALSKNLNQKANNFIELILEAESERIKLEKEKNSSAIAIKYLTNNEIIAQSMIFFIAGFDTTQTALTHAIYELGMHPEYQEQLYDEIQDVLQQNPDKKDAYEVFTYDVLQKMQFLNAVIEETLRLHTPATNTEREASEDITLESSKHKIHVKKDDILLIPIYSLHRDKDNFPEPDVFDPNRFIGQRTYHKYSFLPFGAGPRDCVARSLAYFEVRIAVVHFILNYRVEPCEKTPIQIEYYFQILGGGLFNKDVHMKIVPRSFQKF